MIPIVAFLSATPAIWLTHLLACAWDDTRPERIRAIEHRSPGTSRNSGIPRPHPRAGGTTKGAAT